MKGLRPLWNRPTNEAFFCVLLFPSWELQQSARFSSRASTGCFYQEAVNIGLTTRVLKMPRSYQRTSSRAAWCECVSLYLLRGIWFLVSSRPPSEVWSRGEVFRGASSCADREAAEMPFNPKYTTRPGVAHAVFFKRLKAGIFFFFLISV